MKPAYGIAQRSLEYGAIGMFAMLACWSAWRLADAAGAPQWPLLLAAIFAGWLATDFLSGLLHWAFDSWGSVHTPLIGNSLIRPFREHHVDPQAMTRHDFVETHGASCLAALPFLALSCVIPPGGAAPLATHAFLLSLALGALATNQCHKWAHMEERDIPAWVLTLQRRRILLSRAHHGLHHTAPFDTHFCMTNGWFNPLFNAVLRKWR